MHTQSEAPVINICDQTSVDECIGLAAKMIAKALLFDANEAALESRILFEHVSGKNRAWQILHCEDALSKETIDDFVRVVNERLLGTPVAYITGTQAFWSLDLEVQACTLIPRQDTETLVEVALELALPKEARALDLGTGTGAIALALAKERPTWQVQGFDFIAEAVALANRNAQRNHIKAMFTLSNWFSALQSTADEKFDLIVSNPPYVEPDSEYLKRGDLRFEPLSALTAQDNGLADIRHIIQEAPQYLNKGGYIVLEHGMSQGMAIRNMLKQRGFVQIMTKSDYNGLPRVTLGQYL